MNKELKNQLKAYGFQKEVNHYYKIIGNYRFSLGCELVDLEVTEIISGKVHSFGFIKTFARIALAIQELTGVTLTPKPTKRQAIDKNTARSIGNNAEIVQNRRDIKKFNRNAEENRIATLATIDELKERIDALEKNTPLFLGMDFGLSSSETAITVIRNQGGSLFAKKITESEIESGDHVRIVELNEESEWELNEICKVLKVSGFMVLLCKQNYKHEKWFKLDQVTKDLGGAPELEGLRHLIDTGQATPSTTKAEPKSEPEKTEGVFKVGDPVCVKPYPVYAFNSSATKRNLAKYGAVLVIQDVCGNKRVPGGLEIETDNGRYTVGELQHAPKEAAKVLEFDTWAAIKTGDYRLNEGTKVLLIQELEISGGKLWWRCYTDKDRGSINILAEDLKAL
jgi:hypothetical protein